MTTSSVLSVLLLLKSKALKGIIVNRVMLSLPEGSLEIIGLQVTVNLKPFVQGTGNDKSSICLGARE